MIAWHGSDTRFDRFDLAFVKCGEGSMVRGHGAYLAEARACAERYRDILARRTGLPGYLYKVQLAPELGDFLDQEKLLADQSAKVRHALGITDATLERYWKTTDLLERGRLRRPFSEIGRKCYARLANQHGNGLKASAWLLARGIPGMAYLDQVSRKIGRGTRNLVVFYAALITILQVDGGEPGR